MANETQVKQLRELTEDCTFDLTEFHVQSGNYK